MVEFVARVENSLAQILCSNVELFRQWNVELRNNSKKRMVKKYRGKKSEQKFAILNVNKMGNNKLQIKYPLLRSLEMFEIRIENAFHVS